MSNITISEYTNELTKCISELNTKKLEAIKDKLRDVAEGFIGGL